MWTIRQEQMPALQHGGARNFEDYMVVHLKEFAPALCKVRGERCLRRAIRMGLEKAGSYGFTDLGPVRLYIELMFPLGAGFDTDFQLPWVREVLTDPEPMTQTIRAQRLYRKVRMYLENVAGPRARFTVEALRRVTQMQLGDLEAPTRNLEVEVIKGLKAMHPQKCHYVGEAILRTLFGKAAEAAKRNGISSPLGVRLLAGLMFGFGHGVTEDPLYPWVSATLVDPLVKDPTDRARRLSRKAKIYVEWMLPNLIEESRRV